jgi:hypothetical protein
MSVSYVFVNATPSHKTATDSSDPKMDSVSINAQYLCHHSLDMKRHFLHVKFEVQFVISSTRKSMSNKKWHFSWGMAHPFSKKRGFKKSTALWLSELEDVRNIWCRYSSKDKLVKPKVRFVQSYIWQRVKFLSYTKSNSSQSNSSGISVPSIKLSPENRNGSHGDGFK